MDQEVPGSRPGGGTIKPMGYLETLLVDNFKPDIELDA